ncbi:MAG TPA: hypothetical protein P5328_00260 [Candidatus Paceibacterota bacterium]|nr:hypothetical protein [Candidatus Paceibacterota bacterium]HRZ34240.1 hypothetical protein [Candidatus Paceibacterota bacterium]
MESGESNNQIIIERFRALPKSIQEAIVNSHWEQKIRIIAQKNNLVIGDASVLETETFLVMLGITSPRDYMNKLRQELNLSPEVLSKIVNSVEEEIFQNIKQQLIELEEEEKKAEEAAKKAVEQGSSRENSEVEIISAGGESVAPVPEIPPEPALGIDNEVVIEDLPKDTILEKKLLNTTEAQKESHVISTGGADVANTNANIQKSRPVDPYREPLD